MLRELVIENFALIDALRLELGPGLTVLTGETGAGKSIIIDALGAALGEKVSPEAVREGASGALVEAVFDCAGSPRKRELLTEVGLADGQDGTLILTRQITGGRSNCRVNRRMTTMALLQELGRDLVDIHGQHEHQQLIHEQHHLGFLDNYGAEKLAAELAEFRARHTAYLQARRALDNSRNSERERAQRADLLRFQIEEIDRAALEPDEDVRLESERLRLSHAEKLRESVSEAGAALDGDGQAPGVADALLGAERLVDAAASLDPELAPLAAELASSAVSVREVARALREYLERLEFDPARLESVIARLVEIGRLKRKYGDTLEEVLMLRGRAAAELAELAGVEDRMADLAANLDRMARAAGEAAWRLSQSRRVLALELAERVESEVRELGMPSATFEVELRQEEASDGLPGPNGRRYRADADGIDRCRFLLSANQGEALRPLASVASGGELSRLMLALKSICSRGGQIPTIVFDEVDAGIGGRTAHSVARQLARVAGRAQVLCVTHLPQIAAAADRQISVAKAVVDGRTLIRATEVAGEDRVEELVRMLGADSGAAAARQHARQMLDEARAEREQLGR